MAVLVVWENRRVEGRRKMEKQIRDMTLENYLTKR